MASVDPYPGCHCCAPYIFADYRRGGWGAEAWGDDDAPGRDLTGLSWGLDNRFGDNYDGDYNTVAGFLGVASEAAALRAAHPMSSGPGWSTDPFSGAQDGIGVARAHYRRIHYENDDYDYNGFERNHEHTIDVTEMRFATFHPVDRAIIVLVVDEYEGETSDAALGEPTTRTIVKQPVIFDTQGAASLESPAGIVPFFTSFFVNADAVTPPALSGTRHYYEKRWKAVAVEDVVFHPPTA